jgi:dihydrofolate reductase
VRGRQKGGPLREESIVGKVVVVENVTLDGVMQAPGGAEEDVRGGFPHGGWARPYADQVMAETMGKGMSEDGAMLFGRRTYEQFYGFWSKQTDGNPYTEVLNRKHKYVASRTLAEPLPWVNSSLLKGDAAGAVAALKRDVEGDLVVLGSGDLVRSLSRAGLVDVYTLSIHPLTLGTGTKLFTEGEDAYGTFELVGAMPTTTGVIIATYRPTP